ncbi:sigma-70 family RNA polymerase sigma factor [Amycolatopsis tucumanensis]|uniref:Sigma-70 family RNA polymerase sigma factor n=1 Tax=Amycolatopsis tucumanensis TaxID=401106 RepID=A0ABP7I438_9PSEU
MTNWLAARPAGLHVGTVTRVHEVPDEQAGPWALVRAAQQGDTAAFGALYDQYVDVVYRYVYFRLSDRELAEDITSETFLRALRRISSVSYQGRDVGAWFVTIARNIVLDHLKSSRYKLEVVTDEVADSGTAPFAAPSGAEPGPEQQAVTSATRDALLSAIAGLGEDQRECIVLRFIQGLSLAETAQIMKRNEGAIKALQHRAVRKLAQLLPDGWR